MELFFFIVLFRFWIVFRCFDSSIFNRRYGVSFLDCGRCVLVR